jgi:predicted glycosyltransferase
VMGPRSSLSWEALQQTVGGRDRVRFHREVRDMPYLNVSADLVISSGGYNTLLEALQGNAHILCFPLRRSQRDEQYQHAARLQRFVKIDVSTDLQDLPDLFQKTIDSLSRGRCGDRRAELDLAGAQAIERTVLQDLHE